MTRLRRGPALGGAAAVALVSAAVSSACGTEDVPVALLPAPEAGHTLCAVPSADGGVVATLGDAGLGDAGAIVCPLPGQFCQSTTCTATMGTCEMPPTSCDDQPYDPVCGCNGVAYFNDCLRQSAGIASSTPGTCASAPRLCGETAPCPESDAGLGVCAPVEVLPPFPTLFNEVLCAFPTELPQGVGSCWLVPSKPPSTPGGTQLQHTDQSSETCLSECINPYVVLTRLLSGFFVETTDCPEGGTGMTDKVAAHIDPFVPSTPTGSAEALLH